MILSQFGSNATADLLASGNSKNPTDRMHAAWTFESLQDRRAVKPLLNLLRDDSPQVRLHTTRAAGNNWDKQFVNPMMALFRDPYQEIRSEAIYCLSAHEGKDRTAAYLALLKDANPNVRLCAISVLLGLNRDAIPSESLVRLLKEPNPDIQCTALHFIFKLNRDVASRSDLLPLLGSSRTEIVTIALKLIEGNKYVQPELPEPLASAREKEQRKRWLTSAEAERLTTNQLATARLMGLKILERNADAKAIELTLRLLRDNNRVVRGRAFAVLKTVTGQDVSETDRVKWEQWWAVNRNSFIQRNQSRRLQWKLRKISKMP